MFKKLKNKIYSAVYNFFFDIVVHAVKTFKLDEMVREELRRDAHNISKEMQMRALRTSVDYAEKHLFLVDSFNNNEDLWAHSVDKVIVKDGLYLEFGVFQGRSINFVADRISSKIYGFDSFEGLPERWFDLFDKGHFAVDQLPEVRPNVELIKGWYNETLPGFMKEHKEPIAYLHVDCDLYSSTKTVFDELEDQIVPGTVIVFDELYNFPRWEEGEYKALIEFAEKNQAKYEHIAYHRHDAQVTIQITEIRGEKLS